MSATDNTTAGRASNLEVNDWIFDTSWTYYLNDVR